jgi:hypothetical protein
MIRISFSTSNAPKILKRFAGLGYVHFGAIIANESVGDVSTGDADVGYFTRAVLRDAILRMNMPRTVIGPQS